jgi:hypothetical protein
MADVTYSIDTTHIVYDSYASSSSTIGLNSIYVDKLHPQTEKKITPWKWDETLWNLPQDVKSQAYIASIFDAAESGINHSHSVNGIGDNDDLKLLEVKKEIIDDVEKWTPVINHGYYYVDNQERYLFADSRQAEIFRHDSIYSGLQYLELSQTPKYTTPITVNSYIWNKNLKRYEIAENFRKKLEFTGTLVSGEELQTINDDYLFVLENIDTTKKEFLMNPNIDSGEYLYLNQSYTTWVGDNSYFSGLEFLDLDTTYNESGVFHTQYSPVDSTSGLYIWVDSGTYTPEEWTMIDADTEFTPGPAKEFKVDEVLGLIIFGNYSDIFTDGSGLIPDTTWTIGGAYSKSLLVEYEVLNTDNLVDGNTANLNPLYNPSASGFVKVEI